MEKTTHLKLPYILPAQAQKHVTHNEALGLLDALVMLSVASRNLFEPVDPPGEGDRYIVPNGATGDFAGRDGLLALFDAGSWAFLAPQPGWTAWCADDGRFLIYDGVNFVPISVDYSDRLGINTTADEANRLAVRSANMLLTAEAGSCRLAVNKDAASDTASLVFQTSYAGMAEIGLAGDNNLAFKVHAGGAWRTALAAKGDNGYVGIGTATPQGPLHVRHDGFSATVEMWIEDAVNENVSLRMKHAGCTNNGFDFSVDSSESLVINLRENAPIRFQTNNTERMRLTASGYLGIGVTNPTCMLEVAGSVRIGQKTVATLPSAITAGAGAMVYVPDRGGEPALAVSDGSVWRYSALSV